MVIDKDKQYRTTDGCDARIYATDANKTFPVHGAIFRDGRWLIWCWTNHGKEFAGDTSPNDLVEIKPRINRTYWINIYDGTKHSSLFDAKADADLADKYTNLGNRIACIKVVIDCEEGEGL